MSKEVESENKSILWKAVNQIESPLYKKIKGFLRTRFQSPQAKNKWSIERKKPKRTFKTDFFE